MRQEDFDEYIRQVEPSAQESAQAWSTAIGLQAVDGLKPSTYLLETAKRNIVVAEAMKVLGFVNRHSRGVLKVQKDLVANENGMPTYDFSYQTAVSVRENKSHVVNE